jgi:hypothetical protein
MNLAIAVLSAIEASPGINTSELAARIGGTHTASGMAATTSGLIRRRRLNRVKLEGEQGYRYYPRTHPLPAGVSAWSNRLGNNGARRRAHTPRSNGTPPQHVPPLLDEEQMPLDFSGARRTEHTAHAATSARGTLVVIETGTNETATLTVQQARAVFRDLAELFGVAL